MSVSIKTVAERAGVSTATVSRAFSQKNYVSKETRDHILKVANELGFLPKTYKKHTAKNAYRSTVGVILPTFNNNFYYEIISGIEQVLDEYDIDILYCYTWNSPQKEIMHIDLFQRIKPSGVIIVPCSAEPEENRECLRELAAETKVLLLDRDLKGENLDGVFMNNYSSAYQGTKVLINEGHKDIAFLCGPLSTTSGLERYNGFKQAMLDSGLTVKNENILNCDFDFKKAYTETKNFLTGKRRVTAFFSSSSGMAYGSMLAITESGLSIPRDVGFLTFGYSEQMNDSISYLQYPSSEMGQECARVLLERMTSAKHKKNALRKRSIFEMSVELRGSEKMPISVVKQE